MAAPSPRNIQPWAFAFSGADDVDLIFDQERARPVADPFNRELVISCGVALGYARLWLRSSGIDHRVTLFPRDYDLYTLARISITGHTNRPDKAASAEVAVAEKRHTNWGPFAQDGLSDEEAVELCTAATAWGMLMTRVPMSQHEAIARLITQVDQRQYNDPAFRDELRQWGTGRPVALGSVVPWVNEMRGPDLAGTLFVLTTVSDTDEDWLVAGQALARVLLRATRMGFDATFMNQALQVTGSRANSRNRNRRRSLAATAHPLRPRTAPRETHQATPIGSRARALGSVLGKAHDKNDPTRYMKVRTFPCSRTRIQPRPRILLTTDGAPRYGSETCT